MGGIPKKARTTSRDTKKAPLISYVTGKRKKQDSLDYSGIYFDLNDCEVRRGMSVANLNAKGKKVFCDHQLSEQNNTAEQSDKLQQLYTDENHSYNANLLIRDSWKHDK